MFLHNTLYQFAMERLKYTLEHKLVVTSYLLYNIFIQNDVTSQDMISFKAWKISWVHLF